MKEVHGEAVEGWRNKIYWGDNLQVMSHLLKEFRGKVNLVYIDPPFASSENYRMTIRRKGGSNEKTKLPVESSVFEDKQYTDMWSNDEYLQFLFERLILLKELMQDGACIYVHSDYRVDSYVRLLLDEVFGKEAFVNEIIWYYTNKYGANSAAFDSFHNTIYVYSKGKEFVYNPVLVPVKEARMQPVRRWNKDLGINEWLRDENGKNLYQESREKEIGDVWEIPVINPMASERTGYPTQKPEALLERIIQASSDPGDIVFDCFMGSGTTQSVATQLGRRFIGADINLGAVQITTKRLLAIPSDLEHQQQQGNLQTGEEPITPYTSFEVHNVNHYDVFRNPLEAKDILLEALEVQPLERGHLFDGIKDDRMVKIMPVNRIATRADLTELTTGFDYKAFEKRQKDAPTKPVEKILLVCMGHEPDLAAVLEKEAQPFKIDVEVVDILRDKSNLEFKRDSEAQIKVQGKHLVVEKFYPMNLLQKLSLQQENVEDWRELVESIMIDWNYDGAILEPKHVDIPDKNDLVKGRYEIPDDAGTIRVKITDLLSESLEVEVQHG
ncbi:DNA-methyltransferase [Phormidesmis sp. 146-33]